MIKIDDTVSFAVPEAALGVLKCRADVFKSGDGLLAEFDFLIQTLVQRYELSSVSENPHVSATRKAYKALGKDPSKYRNSAEAMLRRIAKGNGLYRINNAVDINNIVSISSGYSLGSYDLSAVRGEIVWKRAPDGEKYSGIGKDVLNIEHLPALFDDEGVFGNPSADSRRTMIGEGEDETLLYVIFSFDGTAELDGLLTTLQHLLETHANGRDFERQIVRAAR